MVYDVAKGIKYCVIFTVYT